MKEIKLNEIILRRNLVDKFESVKIHMESCYEEELSNEFVAWFLIDSALHNYEYE